MTMERPFAVVYATEKDSFEPLDEFFDTEKEAAIFYNKITHEIANQGYRYFARICKDEKQYQMAMDEITPVWLNLCDRF